MKPTWRLDREAVRRLSIGWPTEYRWHPGTRNWVEPIMAGMAAHGARIERRPVEQPYTDGVAIEVDGAGERRIVVIDHGDHVDVSAEGADDALAYFKLNYAVEGYPQASIVPGGYMCASAVLYRRLPLLRALRGRQRFSYDVYGRFGLRFPSQTRKRAFEILSARTDFRYEGSLFRYPGGPDKVPYKRYLREITQAKVCVDMPDGGDLTYRLVDYLAVGSCVVRPRGIARLHVPLRDGEQIAYCEPDLSDLGDVCARLVSEDAERERIARGARDYFDRYLHQRQLGAYYLYVICGALDGGRPSTLIP
jgi:Glycosyl transferases group 1